MSSLLSEFGQTWSSIRIITVLETRLCCNREENSNEYKRLQQKQHCWPNSRDPVVTLPIHCGTQRSLDYASLSMTQQGHTASIPTIIIVIITSGRSSNSGSRSTCSEKENNISISFYIFLLLIPSLLYPEQHTGTEQSGTHQVSRRHILTVNQRLQHLTTFIINSICLSFF